MLLLTGVGTFSSILSHILSFTYLEYYIFLELAMMQPPKVNTPNSVVHNRVGTVQQVPGHQTWSAVVQGVLLLKS